MPAPDDKSVPVNFQVQRSDGTIAGRTGGDRAARENSRGREEEAFALGGAEGVACLENSCTWWGPTGQTLFRKKKCKSLGKSQKKCQTKKREKCKQNDDFGKKLQNLGKLQERKNANCAFAPAFGLAFVFFFALCCCTCMFFWAFLVFILLHYMVRFFNIAVF